MSRLVKEPIDENQVVNEIACPEAGAILTFAGTVRDEHVGRQVVAIDYHAYDSMAVKEMDRLENQIRERWPNSRIAIVHRVGYLQVGETSVFIAVASAHRKEGFEALRFAIDTLKQSTPIWKKEIYTDGHAWIEGS